MSDSIIEQVEKIHNIPTLPVIAQEILNITNDQTLSVDKLKDIIGKDPAIMAKILSVANSAYFRVDDRTTNLNDAMMRIGLNNVKNIAIGISVLTLLSDGKKTSGYSRLFNHSVLIGLTARSIARHFKMRIEEDIMTEGLLHDIGYFVLNKYFPETYNEILSTSGQNKPILEVEKDVISHTHADIGFFLANKWELPDTLLDVILYHHEPSAAVRNEQHVAIVHIADYLISRSVCSPIQPSFGLPLDRGSLDILKITDNDLKDIERSVCNIHNNEESMAIT